MTPAELLALAQQVLDREPGAELVKNAVGNIAILAEDDGEYIGYIDLRYPEVHWLTDHAYAAGDQLDTPRDQPS